MGLICSNWTDWCGSDCCFGKTFTPCEFCALVEGIGCVACLFFGGGFAGDFSIGGASDFRRPRFTTGGVGSSGVSSLSCVSCRFILDLEVPASEEGLRNTWRAAAEWIGLAFAGDFLVDVGFDRSESLSESLTCWRFCFWCSRFSFNSLANSSSICSSSVEGLEALSASSGWK